MLLLPQSLSIADSGYAITELRGRSYLLEWADNPTWGATQELNDGCHPSPQRWIHTILVSHSLNTAFVF